MGKGDKKSKKGKIAIGSYGNSRKKKDIKERIKRASGGGASAEVPSAKPKRTAKKKTEA